MNERIGFTEKIINALQARSIPSSMDNVLTNYLSSFGRIIWDDSRALFWVNHPSKGFQVALWLMDIALEFEPTKGESVGYVIPSNK